MNFFEGLGIFSIFLLVVLVVISILFSAITAVEITNAIGSVGLTWWIVALTLFASLGGTTGGAIVKIGRD